MKKTWGQKKVKEKSEEAQKEGNEPPPPRRVRVGSGRRSFFFSPFFVRAEKVLLLLHQMFLGGPKPVKIREPAAAADFAGKMKQKGNSLVVVVVPFCCR